MKRIMFYLILLSSTLLTAQAGTKVNESVDLGGNRQATWYIPDEPATGWMLLQHGFQRNKNNLDHIATTFMDNGILVLTLNSNVTGGNKSLARNVADDLIDQPLTPPNGVSLPDQFIVAGHSAGGLFVSYLSGRLMERGYTGLDGVLLFDVVDKDNGMAQSLPAVVDNGIPVLSVMANSSSCNSSNNAFSPLRDLNASFVGIKLTNNSKHTDVEGDSTGGIITWICGSPKDYNVDYLQEFSTAWALDMINGTVTSEYYPNGAKLNQLISDGDGVLLKEITVIPPTANFTFEVNDLAVTFTNGSSDGDAAISSYSWDFGDGQSSSQENPSHTYSDYGTYNVTLTVTDELEQSASISKTVTILSDIIAPEANFSASVDNLSVSFTDQSTDEDGVIESWSWDFGDGATASVANPSHSYSEAGSYDVTLTVTDNDGMSDSMTQNIVVSTGDNKLVNGETRSNLSAARQDALHFSMDVPADAANLEFKISGGSGDADIYVRFGAAPTTSEWDYRPYKNGNNETVTIASPQSGTWYLMVHAYQNYSGVALTASYDTVDNQAPTADFTSSASGLTVQFNDNASDSDGNVVSHEWSFGDGAISNEENPSHTYAEAGSYTVTLTVTDDDGATDQVSKSIVITDGEQIIELVNGQTVASMSGSRNSEQHFVIRNVPSSAAQLIFQIAGGSGDADIYIRYGASPTTSIYDYRPYRSGNDETVTVPSPQSGDWYIMIHGYQSFSGVDLSVSY